MDFAFLLLLWPALLKGLGFTLLLSCIAIIGGMILGILAGIGVSSKHRVIRAPFALYTGIFRGSPLLVQLFMLYLGLAYVGINVPVFAAACGGFILYAGAYIAEIVRSGIASVPRGQFEAAESLGLTRTQTMVRTILPQTLQIALPALLGFNISVVKDTSIASIIGFSDLMKEGTGVIAITSQPFETYLVIGVAYFLICFPLSRLVAKIERKSRFA